MASNTIDSVDSSDSALAAAFTRETAIGSSGAATTRRRRRRRFPRPGTIAAVMLVLFAGVATKVATRTGPPPRIVRSFDLLTTQHQRDAVVYGLGAQFRGAPWQVSVGSNVPDTAASTIVFTTGTFAPDASPVEIDGSMLGDTKRAAAFGTVTILGPKFESRPTAPLTLVPISGTAWRVSGKVIVPRGTNYLRVAVGFTGLKTWRLSALRLRQTADKAKPAIAIQLRPIVLSAPTTRVAVSTTAPATTTTQPVVLPVLLPARSELLLLRSRKTPLFDWQRWFGDATTVSGTTVTVTPNASPDTATALIMHPNAFDPGSTYQLRITATERPRPTDVALIVAYDAKGIELAKNNLVRAEQPNGSGTQYGWDGQIPFNTAALVVGISKRVPTTWTVTSATLRNVTTGPKPTAPTPPPTTPPPPVILPATLPARSELNLIAPTTSTHFAWQRWFGDARTTTTGRGVAVTKRATPDSATALVVQRASFEPGWDYQLRIAATGPPQASDVAVIVAYDVRGNELAKSNLLRAARPYGTEYAWDGTVPAKTATIIVGISKRVTARWNVTSASLRDVTKGALPSTTVPLVPTTISPAPVVLPAALPSRSELSLTSDSKTSLFEWQNWFGDATTTGGRAITVTRKSTPDAATALIIHRDAFEPGADYQLRIVTTGARKPTDFAIVVAYDKTGKELAKAELLRAGSLNGPTTQFGWDGQVPAGTNTLIVGLSKRAATQWAVSSAVLRDVTKGPKLTATTSAASPTVTGRASTADRVPTTTSAPGTPLAATSIPTTSPPTLPPPLPAQSEELSLVTLDESLAFEWKSWFGDSSVIRGRTITVVRNATSDAAAALFLRSPSIKPGDSYQLRVSVSGSSFAISSSNCCKGSLLSGLLLLLLSDTLL